MIASFLLSSAQLGARQIDLCHSERVCENCWHVRNNTHLTKILAFEILPVLEGLLSSGQCFRRGQNVLLPFLFAASVTLADVKPFVVQTFF